MPTSLTLADARSLLFVPGNRPDRFDKAVSSGSDAVILDLEDAVGEESKSDARRFVRDWLAGRRDGAVVRVNAVGTTWHDDDVDAVVNEPGVTVMLPKASLASVTALACRLSPDAQLIALIETAQGVLETPAIAGVPGVARLAFGNVDLGAEIGVDSQNHLALAGARSILVYASAASGLPAPIDGVTKDILDEAAVTRDAEQARSLGFTGKLCIHPSQIEAVHRALAPSESELAFAGRVVAAAGDGDVIVLDGVMVDRPVLERARRLLRAAVRDASG